MRHLIAVTSNLASFTITFLVLLALLLSGCQDADTESDNTPSYTISGTIQAEDASFVENALVTIDGIEAIALTDANGDFVVASADDFESTALLSASKDGFESYSQEVTLINDGDTYKIEGVITLAESIPWDYIEIEVQPSNSEERTFKSARQSVLTIAGRDDVCDCTVTLSGKAYKVGGKKTTAYILLAVDASGSSSEKTIGDQTVFEIEINALKALVNRLTEDEKLNVAIIRFASEATLPLAFTTDLEAVISTLNGMTPETPRTSGAATNYQAALELAIESFKTENPKKKDIKTMVFLSDGIPTHPFDSGITQEKGDRLSAVEAAKQLKEENIVVNTFAVNVVSKLTTLPAISAITGGFYYDHETEATINSIVKYSLVGLKGIEVINETTDTQALGFELFPDGRFSGEVCLTDDSHNYIKVTPLVCEDCEKPAYQKVKASCAGEECSACAGQFTMLELKYNGPLENVAIRVEQLKKAPKTDTIFDDTVSAQETFQFFGSAKDKTMGPNILIYVNDVLNAEFITSCGEPKTLPGLVSGDIEVVRGYSRNGGLICAGG